MNKGVKEKYKDSRLHRILIKAKFRITFGQIICLIISLALFAYPVVIDYMTQHDSDELITTYTKHVQDNDEQNERLLAEAHAYNDRLSNTDNDYEGTIPPEYEIIAGLDMPFAWVEFPQLDQRIPVYHGTSYDALQAGVGHLSGTSIPVGGESTHAVLTGHSGMRGSRMFDDIDQLQNGDIFFVHILDQTLAYKVYGHDIVLPYETDSLKIQKGRDLCSLITCYPYGVNTHRYIVHAERADYNPDDAMPDNTGAVFNQRTYPLWFVLIVLCFFLLFWYLLRPKEIEHNAKWLKRFYRHDKQPIIDLSNVPAKAEWESVYEYDFMHIRPENIEKAMRMIEEQAKADKWEAWLNGDKEQEDDEEWKQWLITL